MVAIKLLLVREGLQLPFRMYSHTVVEYPRRDVGQMFLMKVGGIVYADGTKVRRTTSMSEDITRVRKDLGQMVECPEKDMVAIQ